MSRGPSPLAVLSLSALLLALPAFGSTQFKTADPARVSLKTGGSAAVSLYGAGLTDISGFGLIYGGKATTRVSSKWTRSPSDSSGQIMIVAGADAPAGPYEIFAITRFGNVKIPVDLSVVAPPPTDAIAPTAIITAPQTIPFGNALTLSGANSSDVGGQIIRWTWTKIEGSGGNVALNQQVQVPSSTLIWPVSSNSPLGLGRHRFRLVVTDDSGNQSEPAEVQLFVIDSQKPTAILTLAAQGSPTLPISLGGSSSLDTGGGKVVSYTWTKLTGSGGAIPLNQQVVTSEPSYAVQASPAFVPGTHQFRLQVTDDSGNVSEPDVKQIVILALDQSAPNAVITAPQTVPHGTQLQLSGASSSDVGGGNIVSWTWTKLEGTGGTVPINQQVQVSTSTLIWPVSSSSPLALGRHRFRLVVTDNSGNQSEPAEVQLFVIDSQKPTAVLKAPSQIIAAAPIVLDGSSSVDAGGGKVTEWRWTKLDGSGGAMVINQAVATPTPSYTVSANPAFAVGTHRFQLVVVDDSGNVSAPAVVQVAVVQ